MKKSSIHTLRKQAEAVRDRLEDKAFSTPTGFKPHVKTFIAIQTKFEAAAIAAEQAESARDDALALVGDEDTALDTSLDDYADAVSAAKLGPRVNPFKPYSRHAPSALKDLPYAKEPAEVRDLVAAVAKKKPPVAVTKAGAVCLKRCAAVEKALKDFGKPAAAYQKALATRDAILPELQKALKTLKTHAASAFADDAATLATLFAPPEALQAPKQRRKKATPPAKVDPPAGP
jgi:hypothetical protein